MMLLANSDFTTLSMVFRNRRLNRTDVYIQDISEFLESHIQKITTRSIYLGTSSIYKPMVLYSRRRFDFFSISQTFIRFIHLLNTGKFSIACRSIFSIHPLPRKILRSFAFLGTAFGKLRSTTSWSRHLIYPIHFEYKHHLCLLR
jgi:hypothetical protein